jgi:hypothetical protein
MIVNHKCECITQDSEFGVAMIELCKKHKDKWDLMFIKHRKEVSQNSSYAKDL